MYDAAGNREQQVEHTPESTITSSYTYDANNRLLKTEKQADSVGAQREIVEYSYDHNGNMISKLSSVESSASQSQSASLEELGSEGAGGAALYEYDVWNNLVKTIDGQNIVEMTYNGDGQRVSKGSGGSLMRHMYESDQVILEVDGAGNQTAYNMYGTDLLKRSVDGESLLYLYNGHSDVTALMTSSGSVAASYYYDAFGNITETTGQVNNPFRYAGYQYDEESKLYYLNSRHYAPDIARFMQEDTYLGDQADPLSLNLYTYCSNNPLIYVDPTGHKGQVVIMTHGLNSDVEEFEKTVQNLKEKKNEDGISEYISLGAVMVNEDGKAELVYNSDYLNRLEAKFGAGARKNPDKYISKMLDELTGQGYNVLIRTQFSKGNLSFDDQHKETGDMMYRLGDFKADVTFIGHSMGGLASINYGIDYAEQNKNKKVNIITVSTPYHENAWAATDWRTAVGDKENDMGKGINGPVGKAQKDLGGISDALEKLKTKWNKYKENGGTATLYAISVSMYNPHDGRKGNKEYDKTHEKNWSDKGDGVVDIPSQQGEGWSHVNVIPMIKGTGKGHALPINDLQDTEHSYHHVNTPDRKEVANLIHNILKK